ncbi:MAG: hypothetical protein CME64_10830 [Halobacteriovoraceae bacterium]|nr:hypothetical protein [Halobacteriovoraceae bacterium]
MILPLRLYREHSIFKSMKLVVSSATLKLVGVFGMRPSFEAGYSKQYPVLKRNEQGVPECVSCGLCVEICPTKAIKIEVDKKIQIPKTLTSGPAPKMFEVDHALCVQCSLCEQVCPVDAITVI